jgi:hypothetical protein
MAAIGRTNDKGQQEFWHHEGEQGKETVQTLDGTTRVKTWFASGVLVGKTRQLVVEKQSKVLLVYKVLYNEIGNVLRVESVSRKKGFLLKSYSPSGTHLKEYALSDLSLAGKYLDGNTMSWPNLGGFTIREYGAADYTQRK